MKVVFAGTPSVALPTLELLLSSGHEVVGVLTREDSLIGRKKILTPSPVAVFAQSRGLPVIKANVMTEEIVQTVRNLDADVGIVIAFGALLPGSFLSTTKHGWYNLHFSRLPRYRGAAPAQWAIRNGDFLTGSTLFKIDQGLDTGEIYSIVDYDIYPDETSGELLERMSIDCAQQVLSFVDSCERDGDLLLSPQNGEATYAHKLRSEDGYLDLSFPSPVVYDKFRSVTPEPGAFVLLNGERIKICVARHAPDASVSPFTFSTSDNNVFLGCSSGALLVNLVQPAGKKIMRAQDWWRGLHVDSLEVDQ